MRDVRMRGFESRALVADALAWVDASARPLPEEAVVLQEAHGRVLAAPVTARLDVPTFDRSAMDGYALHGLETVGASDYSPLPFQIVGESLPGRPFSGHVGPGQAVRIMTGAPLPAGADAVLPAEFAQESTNIVEALTAVPPGKHIGRRGEDVGAGTVILPAGRRLRPQDVGLMAAVDVPVVPVIRRPRVRVLTTGPELAPPGMPRRPFQIIDSNSDMLAGLIARDGGLLERLQRLPDERAALEAAVIDPGADIIVISGGSSVGAEDHAPGVIRDRGELVLHGLAMRPSSPAGMGRVGAALVFLLPGNPVSCLCAYDFFAGRAIRRLAGRPGEWPYRPQQFLTGRKIVSAVGRLDYVRVEVCGGKVEPLATSGASILSSTIRADGFVVVPESLEGYPPDVPVTVSLYDPL